MNRFVKSKPPSFLKVFERNDEKDNRRLLETSMASFADSVLPTSSSCASTSTDVVLGESATEAMIPEEGDEDDVDNSEDYHYEQSVDGEGKLADKDPASSPLNTNLPVLDEESDPADEKPSSDHPPSPITRTRQAKNDSLHEEQSKNSSPVRRSSVVDASIPPSPVGFYRSSSERRLSQMGGLSRAPNSDRSLGSSASSLHHSPTKSTYASYNPPSPPQRLTAVPESLVKHAENALFSPEQSKSSSRKMNLFGRLRSKKDDTDVAHKPEVEVAVAEVDGGKNAMPFAQLTLEAVAPNKSSGGGGGKESASSSKGVGGIGSSSAGAGETQTAKKIDVDETDSEHSFATEKLSNREGRGHHHGRRMHSRHDAAHTSRRKLEVDGAKSTRNSDKQGEHRTKHHQDTTMKAVKQGTENDRRSKPEDPSHDRSSRSGDGQKKRGKPEDGNSSNAMRNQDSYGNQKSTNRVSHPSECPDRHRRPSDADHNDTRQGGKPDDAQASPERAAKKASARSPSHSETAGPASPSRSERRLQHVAETLEWKRVTRSPSKSLVRRESHTSRKSHSTSKFASKSERKDRPNVVRSSSSDVDSSRHSGKNDEAKQSGVGNSEISKVAPDESQNVRYGNRQQTSSKGKADRGRQETSLAAKRSLGNFLDQTRCHSDHASPMKLPHNNQVRSDDVSAKSDGTAENARNGPGSPRQDTESSFVHSSYNGSAGASADVTKPKRRSLFQFPVASEHTLDADIYHNERLEGRRQDEDRSNYVDDSADKCTSNDGSGSETSDSDSEEDPISTVQPVDAMEDEDSHPTQTGASRAHESSAGNHRANEAVHHYCSPHEPLKSPRKKVGGIFESAILQQRVGGEEPDGSDHHKHDTNPTTRSHSLHGGPKQPTRRSCRRRFSATTSFPASASEVPATPVRRHPRRASGAPASTGRNRRVVPAARVQKKQITSEFVSALQGRDNVMHVGTVSPGLSNAIRELDNESQASIELPLPAPILFDEIPFLSISELVTDKAEEIDSVNLEAVEVVPSNRSKFSRPDNFPIGTSAEDVNSSNISIRSNSGSEQLATGESTNEAIPPSKTGSMEVAETKDEEYSRLSIELAQSRIRLREARMEVNQLELDIKLLEDRLSVSEVA